MKATYILRDPQQAYKVITGVLWPAVKSWLICGGGALRITCGLLTRTLEQNAKFHALCSDIARSGAEWAGKRRDADEWKVLLVSGHAVATKEGCEIVPGIEGEFVNIRESTALMSVKRGSSLIEYAVAFCAMNDVPLTETNRWAA